MGGSDLPKFKFSVKFPIVTHNFTTTDKKNSKLRTCNILSAKLFLPKIEVQPCTSLEIMLNGFCLQIIQ